MKLQIAERGMIYIIAPMEGMGGTFSLHQLAKVLVDQGKNVRIYHLKNKLNKEIIKTRFFGEQLQICNEIIDNTNNYVIVPEMYYYCVEKYKYIKKVIWWLSWDYFTSNFYHGQTMLEFKIRGIPRVGMFFLYPFTMIGLLLLGSRRRRLFMGKYFRNANQNIHLYNCEYVLENLLSRGIEKQRTAYLCGPITFPYIAHNKFDFGVKENLIIFPKSKNNLSFINKLIKRIKQKIPEVQVKMIHNMNNSQVKDLMMRAKVYMDFGFFPGPERMPREAAFSYCNIVTSNIGSARNDYDILIPKRYKFTPKRKQLTKIAELVVDMIKNYDLYVDDYELYRKKIFDQQTNFEEIIKQIFV